MESHLEIIKQLVDSLTVSLTNILLKIESINPILNRLSDDISDGKAISKETIDDIKELKIEISNYHDSMTQLPITLSKIKDIDNKIDNVKIFVNRIDDIERKIDDLVKNQESIPDIKETFTNINISMKPISKVCDFLTTPIGIICGIVSASGIVLSAFKIIQDWILPFLPK